MVVPVVTMDYNGKPLDVLNDLIRKRSELLGKSLRDSVVATAITALKSIRAQTKRYKGRLKIKKGGRVR